MLGDWAAGEDDQQNSTRIGEAESVAVELVANFAWGVLLICDCESIEEIPGWGSAHELVATAETAVVVRVRHGDEGEVSVRVLAGEWEARGPLVFEGPLQLNSGILRASDALGHEVLDVPVTPGLHLLRVYADDHLEATMVDLVIG